MSYTTTVITAITNKIVLAIADCQFAKLHDESFNCRVAIVFYEIYKIHGICNTPTKLKSKVNTDAGKNYMGSLHFSHSKAFAIGQSVWSLFRPLDQLYKVAFDCRSQTLLPADAAVIRFAAPGAIVVC